MTSDAVTLAPRASLALTAWAPGIAIFNSGAATAWAVGGLVTTGLLLLNAGFWLVSRRLHRRRTVELYEAILDKFGGEDVPDGIADLLLALNRKALVNEVTAGGIRRTRKGCVSGVDLLAAIGHEVPEEIRRGIRGIA